MQMTEYELKRYIKRRDKALVECFRYANYKLFYSYLRYYYGMEEVERFKKIPNYMKKKTICKMICKVDSIPDHIKEEARIWLVNGKKRSV